MKVELVQDHASQFVISMFLFALTTTQLLGITALTSIMVRARITKSPHKSLDLWGQLYVIIKGLCNCANVGATLLQLPED